MATAALAGSIVTVACTPEQLAWWDAKVNEARGAGVYCPEVAPLIEYFGLPDHFHEVIRRESQCNPNAVNRSSGALGLTQIMPFWLRDLCPLDIACEEWQLLDPVLNIEAAAYVYSVQGPSAWSQTWGGG